jgi:hypothetical protein
LAAVCANAGGANNGTAIASARTEIMQAVVFDRIVRAPLV